MKGGSGKSHRGSGKMKKAIIFLDLISVLIGTKARVQAIATSLAFLIEGHDRNGSFRNVAH